MQAQDYTQSNDTAGNRMFKRWVLPLAALQTLIVLVAIVAGGVLPMLAFLQFIVWVVAAVLLGTRRAPKQRTFGIMLGASVLAVVIISMAGFYANTQISGEFNTGGTHVSSHSLGTALGSALTDPATFTAALFGYECKGALDTTCSSGLYLVGMSIVQALFAAPLVVAVFGSRQERNDNK